MNNSLSRIALGLEYDGSAFHGWQKQNNVISVQSVLEKALNSVAGLSFDAVESVKSLPAHAVDNFFSSQIEQCTPIHTTCAGRTDAGVHASQQVVHFDTVVKRSERAWVMGCNSKLPHSIRVLWAREVPLDFDARRSALNRCYRYIIYNHPIRPSLFRSFVTWYYRHLDIDRMIKASQYWLGEQDFSAFRAAECQSRTPIRCLETIKIDQFREQILLEFKANAFLYHMVRNMVGVLIKIGSGQAEVEWALQVLQGRDRRLAGITAPPEGLYLVNVKYPDIYPIPRFEPGPWFIKFNKGVN